MQTKKKTLAGMKEQTCQPHPPLPPLSRGETRGGRAGLLFLAVFLVIGGLSWGRLTHMDQIAMVGVAQAAPETAAPRITLTPSGVPSFADLADHVSPAVVHVRVVGVERASERGRRFGGPGNPFGPQFPFPPGFGGPRPPQRTPRRSSGSGFIIRKDGLIITNNHVVEGANEIMVNLPDEREYQATVLGRDPKTDLAVLKVESEQALPVANLGDSEDLRVGDWVMAIGNPFGLSNTVTAGIVSAKGRTIGAGPYDDFIQTDASINPGNSGGPLFNEKGEVVGINTAIFGNGGGNIGIGFAIPINLAKQLVPDLETKGRVTRGWLGVTIQKMTTELSESLGLDESHGALVADVATDSPAEKGGMERGDVIVGYGGQKVKENSDLPILVANTKVGTKVPIDVVRDGRTKTLTVEIAKLDEPEVASGPEAAKKGKWGMALRDLTPEERAQMQLKASEGVIVAGVQPDSPAAEAGVREGDVILEVNRTQVKTVDELKKEIATVKEGKPLLLLLRRNNGVNQYASLSAK